VRIIKLSVIEIETRFYFFVSVETDQHILPKVWWVQIAKLTQMLVWQKKNDFNKTSDEAEKKLLWQLTIGCKQWKIYRNKTYQTLQITQKKTNLVIILLTYWCLMWVPTNRYGVTGVLHPYGQICNERWGVYACAFKSTCNRRACIDGMHGWTA
jgi:hypothetical protein